MQAQLDGMQTQQGVLSPLSLVVKKKIGINVSFLQDRLQRHNMFGSGDMPFSIRRGSYRSIMLETV